MQVAADSFKLAFLKRMLQGFRLSVVSSASLSATDRAKAVKLAADAATAAARGGRAGWARGLAGEKRRKGLREEPQRTPRRCSRPWKIPRSKKILRRCLSSWSRRKTAVLSGDVLPRALVRKRIQVLRKLVPGGESMDALSLLDETLDYAASLKAQVDVMRWLLKASEASISKVQAQQSALQMKACGSV